jgi:hypothetical protein
MYWKPPSWAKHLGGGAGTQTHINPLPQAAITIKALITRAPTASNIFSLRVQAPASIFTRVLGERRAIRRGGGGTQAHITPSPQAAITIETPITRASTTQNIFFLESSPGRGLPATPPLRAPAVPRPRFHAAWYKSVYMKCSRHGFLHQRMNTNGTGTKWFIFLKQ